MLDLMNLPDKAFAQRFVLVLLQVIILSLVNFAVGYKCTKLSKCVKNFLQDFSLIRTALNLCRVVFFIQPAFS